MEKTIKWFSENHVAANFLMAVVVLFGISTWFTLKKEIFPDASLDAVTIQVPYPGATPDEVETGVLIPIEEAISDVEGIKKISATGQRNIGTVTVEISPEYDLREVMDSLKTRVDAIDNFAEDAEQAILEEIIIREPVVTLAISADTDERTLLEISKKIRDDLYVHPEPKPTNFFGKIAQLFRGKTELTDIKISGTRDYELSIEIPEQNLLSYNITLEQVGQIIRNTSIDLPAGSVKSDGGEFIIRTASKRYTKEDFANIPIINNDKGGVVYLSDIAHINDGFEDIDIANEFNGKKAALLRINRVGNQDTLILTKIVRDYLAKIQQEKRYPSTLNIDIWDDRSGALQGRLDLLTRNGIFGIILVLIVLALFLRPSLALLVAIGIPVSFAGGIWMMPHTDLSVNMISLFAFILVLGIVVDDAIVVGENVYTQIQKGVHPKKAAFLGTHEVGTVVIFGVLTTVVAFTPMLGIDGVSGKYWRNIPLIVIPTLLFSLIQSKLVLPAHLATLKPRDPNKKPNLLTRTQRTIASSLEYFANNIYQPFVTTCLRFRYLVIFLFLILLVGTVRLVFTGVIKSRFIPDVEGDVLSTSITLAPGTTFEETKKAVNKIETAAMTLDAEYEAKYGKKLINNLLVSSGIQPYSVGFLAQKPRGSNLGQITLEIVPSQERALSSDELLNKWRKLVSDVPNVIALTFATNAAAGGNAIDLEIKGTDRNEVSQAVTYLKNELSTYPGIHDINDTNLPGKDEIRFTKLTPSGETLNLTLGQVATQTRNALFGYEAQTLQRGRDEVKVMVRYPSSERKSLENLYQLRIRDNFGNFAPLNAVASFEHGKSLTSISRVNRNPSIKISADINEAIANTNETVAKFNKETLAKLSTKFPNVSYEYGGEQNDQQESITQMGIGSIFALMGMYVLMAIPLKSYLQPFIIMSVIPFGVVGAILGHLFLGMDLSIMSLCGIIALGGIVVNDSLVLVEYVNRAIKKGLPIRQAIATAGTARFRAILLTSLTTFVGIMPMMAETDMQARFLIPMAISLGFGVLFATAIMLILVPCVFMIKEDFIPTKTA